MSNKERTLIKLNKFYIRRIYIQLTTQGYFEYASAAAGLCTTFYQRHLTQRQQMPTNGAGYHSHHLISALTTTGYI